MTNEQISWMSLYRKHLNAIEDCTRKESEARQLVEKAKRKGKFQKKIDYLIVCADVQKNYTASAKRAAENYVIENPYPKTEE
jgi:hypothetical protein